MRDRFNKNNTRLLTALLCFAIATPVLAHEPRVFLWGLTGSKTLSRLDVMQPLYTDGFSSVAYADVQAAIDTDPQWFTGVGMGYRQRTSFDRLYGAYLFVDRDFSSRHHAYYFLSPGFETIGQRLDGRVNLYIPMSRKKFQLEPTLPTIFDTCGNNFNCEDTFFVGHQQLLQSFSSSEEVGTGVDAETGIHFGSRLNYSLYGGAYYFKFSEDKNMLGAEARVVVPIKPSVALTLEASYDNLNHGKVVAGIRLQGGYKPNAPMTLPEEHLFDPVTRNLATIGSGLGEPVDKRRKFLGNTLIRDNIYFFTSSGGTTFNGSATGTFENPLRADQFTQNTVDAIASLTPTANLFFNPGTYIIEPTSPDAPNAAISLPGGQSIFGRTTDYRCSATGDERPILLGRLNLIAGNNTLDSIRLINSMLLADPTEFVTLIALSITNSPNVLICNSEITSNLTVTGTDRFGVAVIAIQALVNSSVTIENSLITAAASIATAGVNTNDVVIGIGDLNRPVTNNIYTISNSPISATLNIASAENLGNFAAAVGIGSVATAAGLAPFETNTFTLTNSPITVESNSRAFLSTITLESISIGIGTAATELGTANFIGNTFTITAGDINSTAITRGGLAISAGIGTGATDNGTASFSGNRFTLDGLAINSTASNPNSAIQVIDDLLATGIGPNGFIQGNAFFNGDTFNVTDTTINVLTQSVTPNAATGVQEAVGIGSNSDITVGSFNNETFTLSATEINVRSPLIEPVIINEAVGIGANLSGATSTTFNNNLFTMTGGQILVEATRQAGSLQQNYATGIGVNFDTSLVPPFPPPPFFVNTQMTLSNTTLDVEALVIGNNAGQSVNQAIGARIDTGSSIDFVMCNMTVLAEVTGSNSNINQAYGLWANTGSTIDFSSSTGLVEALVLGGGAGLNLAAATNGGGLIFGAGNITVIQSP